MGELPQSAQAIPPVDEYRALLAVSEAIVSHRDLRAQARLTLEFSDLALVFAKIDLILRHWTVLAEANPAPRYRPAPASEKKEAAF